MRKVKLLSVILSCLMILGLFSVCGETESKSINLDNITLNDTQISEITKKSDVLLNSNGFSGSALISLSKNTVYQKSFGYSHKDDAKITDKYIYQLGSLTKAYTGVAVLKLAAEEKIDLDDTIDKYFDGRKYLSKITVQHLLEMRSGLASYTVSLYEDAKAYKHIMSLIEKDPKDTAIKNYIRDFILETGTDNATGSYSLSHSDYYLLGLIIEEVSGKSYENYITENIIKPLKLKNTGLINNDKSFRGYSKDGAQISEKDNKYLNNKYVTYSSLGIYSDINDLNVFYKALLTDKLLGENETELSFIKTIFKSSSGYSCGFYSNNNCIYTQGNTSLHSGDVYINTETNEIAILLSNSTDVDKLEPLTKEVYNITNAKINGMIIEGNN